LLYSISLNKRQPNETLINKICKQPTYNNWNFKPSIIYRIKERQDVDKTLEPLSWFYRLTHVTIEKQSLELKPLVLRFNLDDYLSCSSINVLLVHHFFHHNVILAGTWHT